MSKAYLTVGIILLSILALGAFNLIQNYSSGNELDYYLLKETTEAAMSDSVDSFYFSERGVLRIDKQKFVESFVLRFGANVDDSRAYDIKFYDINEVPPKVTVQVDSLNNSFVLEDSNVRITTRLNAILETNNKSDPLTTKGYLQRPTN